ncbi:beta-eliminating lyase-related protein [Flavobacteriaceae bacterium]|jgi:threonine aldolase|nr:beta-eliminating lyase-related protein [Flavobacteriaceae bacterium]MDB4196408.1 beta-eliminating lyase-related protein [Flavobacteriaceae bacterium]MDB4212862.1 beta-eliminating lyase-related protein [Flavobacteriaceae bacterium]
MIVDLRSDTVTVPSKGMLEFMMDSNVGDDVYGEDPTVNQLQNKVASIFGKDVGMFFPSGTMANQTAIKLHTNPGEQIICDKYSHIYNYEGGGASFNSGVSFNLINGERGMFNAKQAADSINPKDFYHSPLSSLIAVENTTNKGGGACWNINELKQIKKIAKLNNLGMHLDGARIWNALIANGDNPLEIGKIFDTISVCLSKGLGCPIGSVLIGDKNIMNNALRIRKILGGGMRQAGYLANAGLYALDNNIERLSEDHKKAKEIGEVLKKSKFVKSVEKIETNIVIFQLQGDINEFSFIKKLNKLNIKLISMGSNKLRLVTHLNYTNNHHEYFISSIKSL